MGGMRDELDVPNLQFSCAHQMEPATVWNLTWVVGMVNRWNPYSSLPIDCDMRPKIGHKFEISSSACVVACVELEALIPAV